MGNRTPAPPSRPATTEAPPGRCRAGRTDRWKPRRRERRRDPWRRRARPAGRPPPRRRGSRERGWRRRAATACPEMDGPLGQPRLASRIGHPTIGHRAVARRSGARDRSGSVPWDCRIAADDRGSDCRLGSSSRTRVTERIGPVRRMLRPAGRRQCPAGEGTESAANDEPHGSDQVQLGLASVSVAAATCGGTGATPVAAGSLAGASQPGPGTSVD